MTNEAALELKQQVHAIARAWDECEVCGTIRAAIVCPTESEEAFSLLTALLDELETYRTPSGWDPAWLYPLSQRPDLVRTILDAKATR